MLWLSFHLARGFGPGAAGGGGRAGAGVERVRVGPRAERPTPSRQSHDAEPFRLTAERQKPRSQLEPACPHPKGIESSSPGLRGTSYPGSTCKTSSTPTGFWPFRTGNPRANIGHNPVGVGILPTISQGSSCLATLGFESESLWDSHTRLHRKQRKTNQDAFGSRRQAAWRPPSPCRNCHR
jgi:hypothetical protein